MGRTRPSERQGRGPAPRTPRGISGPKKKLDVRRDAASIIGDAELLFREIARTCNLRAEWVQPDVEGGWCRIRAQDDLAFDCTLQVVNDDELWFSVGGFFTLSRFPFPGVGPDFRQAVAGFLSGQSRIRMCRGHAFLERPAGEGWKIEARYSGLRWYGWRERIVFSDGERVA